MKATVRLLYPDNGKSVNDLGSDVELKLKVINEKFGHNSGVKMTTTKDPEGSLQSRAVMRQGTGKKKLSKRESVFYKPTDKDNKVLGELLIKVCNNLPRICLTNRGI